MADVWREKGHATTYEDAVKLRDGIVNTLADAFIAALSAPATMVVDDDGWAFAEMPDGSWKLYRRSD